MADLLTDEDAVVAALLRPLTSNEQSATLELIAQASTLLRGKLSTVDARIALWDDDPTVRPADALDPLLVRTVLAGVIKRYMVNPQGAASISRSTGPYSGSTSFASYGKAIGSEGKLVITDDDLAALRPTSSVLAGTIRTTPELPDCGSTTAAWAEQ